jgi:flagellar hook-length control protein FliK
VKNRSVTSLHAVHLSAASAKVDAASSSLFGPNGLNWFALSSQIGPSFASLLSTASGNTTTSPVASNSLSQLTSMLQNGVPLSTIVNQLTQDVTASLRQQLGGTLSQTQLTALTKRVTTQLSNALDPPANGPPASAAQQASALAQRLDRLIGSLAAYVKQNGQQNDISGNSLDATPAKEAPAQQQQSPASNAPSNGAGGVSSLAQSLLARAIAELQSSSQSSQPSQAPRRGQPLAPSVPTKVNGATQTGVDPNPMTTLAANVQQPQFVQLTHAPGVPLPATGSPVQTAAQSAPPAQAVSMANAPDLLARMLVRAASADPQISGDAGATASVQASGSNGGTGTTSIAATAAELASALADVVANAAQTAGNNAGNLGQHGTQGQTADPLAQPASATATPSSTNAVASVPAFNTLPQIQAAVQTAQAAAQSVDVNSVIEQMVKSMSMRTDAQGSSTINLHLQPENLGDVSMKITVQGSNISANVVAQNADVRSALMQNHQQLAKSLAEAGLTLSGFSVDVSGGNANRDGSRDQTQGFGRRYVVHELNGSATQEPDTTSSLGPPLLGGSSLELFNYLA